MNMTNIIDKEICDILQPYASRFFTQKHIDADTTRQSLGIDSLDETEILMEIEDKYDIELPDDTWTNVHTVSDLINNVKASMPEQICHG